MPGVDEHAIPIASSSSTPRCATANRRRASPCRPHDKVRMAHALCRIWASMSSRPASPPPLPATRKPCASCRRGRRARSSALCRARTRPTSRRATARCAAPQRRAAHLPRHQPDPPRGQTQHERGRGAGPGGRFGSVRAHLVRRRRVLRRGRDPHRARISGRRVGGRRRSRRARR